VLILHLNKTGNGCVENDKRKISPYQHSFLYPLLISYLTGVLKSKEVKRL